ncbi:MAG TPA: prepilin-type N-terminal cleavage/methylation domain-containing protein [Gemmatimonadales bacterium]|nr:prepilin-type N-terminal cleavage/methylation domain-containing protein [Gemmatimonadales bacterium]
MRRRGFTMVEIVVVLVVLGLLSGLAVLKYIDLTRTATAAKIAGEFVTVRLAAYNYEADHNNQWPSDQGPGVIPPEFNGYLPQGFTFTYPSYQLDWDNRTPSLVPYELAISMTTTDPRLVAALRQHLGTRSPYFWVGNRLTFILIDQDGNY